MTTRNGKVITSRKVAIAVLAGIAVLGSVHVSSALMSSVAGESSTAICSFSLDLQHAGATRSQYIAKVVSVIGVRLGNSVEEMYANVQPASYSATDPSEDQHSYPRDTSALSGIDSFSNDCVNCHDGVGASSINVDLRNDPYARRSKLNSSHTDHPIGMDYQNYVAAGKGYKRIDASNLKMIFVNGRVGCLSCHDPLNPEKGHLVMSDRDSALCRTCHLK